VHVVLTVLGLYQEYIAALIGSLLEASATDGPTFVRTEFQRANERRKHFSSVPDVPNTSWRHVYIIEGSHPRPHLLYR
jgi:hypothetical protein